MATTTQAGTASSAGQQLAAYLADLQKKAGIAVTSEEVGHLVDAVLAVSDKRPEPKSEGVVLLEELRSLAEYIRKAKAEIAALRPQQISGEFVPSATDELDAVVDSTEHATHVILENAERIDGECRNMAPELAARVSDYVTEIFTACGFQDLTGQRITKVVRALKDIEKRVDALLSAFGDERLPSAEAKPQVSIYNEASLLNGPQLPDNAMQQSDVDRMFANK